MADSIVTHQQPSNPSPLNPVASRIICHVCQKQFSQYTCPRCNSRYCSLPCYKSHSLRCTESFMRENVMEELQQMRPDDQTKHKMLDILKRFHLEDETDGMDEDDSSLSEETIQRILSGNETTLDDLSAKEQKLFRRAVASGELGKMIEPWNPWWLRPSARTIKLSQEGSQLIQPLINKGTSTSAEDDQPNEIPCGPDFPLPPLSTLSCTEPSPLLVIHLIDIIYSYCFTLRLYNGDWQSDPTGSATMVLTVSSVLGLSGQPNSSLEAVSLCLEQTCSPAYAHMGGFNFGLGLLDDVVGLFSLGGPALICALCDLQRLIQAAKTEMKSEEVRRSKGWEMARKVKLAERKMYFMMCWVHEQKGELWSSMAAVVRSEKGFVVEYRSSNSFVIRDATAGPGRNVRIEEIQ